MIWPMCTPCPRDLERTRQAALAREGYRAAATDDLTDAEAYLAALDELPDE